MKLLPRIILADTGYHLAEEMGERAAPWADAPDRNALMIEPYYAIQWLATGRFVTADTVEPRREWSLGAQESRVFENEQGRVELATELLLEAIQQGKVRCAFVKESRYQERWSDFKHYRLEVVQPEQFLRADVSHSWDGGFQIVVSRQESSADDHDDQLDAPLPEDDSVWLGDGMLFFWDEIAALRPSYQQRPAEITAAAPLPLPNTATPLPHSRRPPPQNIKDTSNRGRAPNRHGAAIAAFLYKSIAGGIDDALAEHRDTLGERLRAEYARLGLPVPSLDNASRDAVAALKVWKETALGGEI